MLLYRNFYSNFVWSETLSASQTVEATLVRLLNIRLTLRTPLYGLLWCMYGPVWSPCIKGGAISVNVVTREVLVC